MPKKINKNRDSVFLLHNRILTEKGLSCITARVEKLRLYLHILEYHSVVMGQINGVRKLGRF